MEPRLPRVAVVGPLPPPAGGMATQTRQLVRLLAAEGVAVQLLATNAPYRPAWISRVPRLRAAFRLLPYLWSLWRAAGAAQVFHVMASSGWAWHLFAAPAVWIAKLRGAKVIVNYRGGQADDFLQRSLAWVRPTLRAADRIVVPSTFLEEVFGRRGIDAGIIPNAVDLDRFRPSGDRGADEGARTPHLVVTRNLEAIYDIPTALRALARLRGAFPRVHMTIAGSGPERARLEALARELGVDEAVTFCGRLDEDAMIALYRSATVALNPSTADNMPNSVLEALACGVPVVTTNVGGVPHLVEHDRSALLVPPGDPAAMADAVALLLRDTPLARRIADGGLARARELGWPAARDKWLGAYRALAAEVPASDLYTRVVAKAVFPLHERLKGHDTVAVRRRLERSQWSSLGHLRQEQLSRLRELLRHAERCVPYYREVFARHGVRADAVATLADLQQIPLLAKADIRVHLEALKAEGARGLKRSSTGGSSGQPLAFYLGPDRISHDVAAKWRATRWWGVDIGDPEAVLWGSPIELGAQDRIRGARDRVLRTRLISAFQMSGEGVAQKIREIRAQRPRMLFGYPSALARLACQCARMGARMDDLGVRVAFVTGESLQQEDRVQIETTFGCPVANGYGGRDAGFVAHQCPEGGMHVSAEDILVEIVSPSGRVLHDGVAGEIVVTHLASRDFPFIRYRTGDVGVLSNRACRCGRSLPLLEEIRGRITDFVVAQDGTVLHGLSMIYVLREIPGIEAFRIVQESLARTVVQVAPGEGYREECAGRIIEGIRARLGAGTEVCVDVVPEIAPEASGKFRYVQSRVAAP